MKGNLLGERQATWCFMYAPGTSLTNSDSGIWRQSPSLTTSDFPYHGSQRKCLHNLGKLSDKWLSVPRGTTYQKFVVVFDGQLISILNYHLNCNYKNKTKQWRLSMPILGLPFPLVFYCLSTLGLFLMRILITQCFSVSKYHRGRCTVMLYPEIVLRWVSRCA